MRRFALGVVIGTGLAVGTVVGGAMAVLRKLDA
jgi:hypothetical protein